MATAAAPPRSFGSSASLLGARSTTPGSALASVASARAVAGSHAGPIEDMFLFVNPRSGGNRGEAFLQAPNPLHTRVGDGRQVRLHIHSLLVGESGNKCGFHALRDVLRRTQGPIRVIVGGGDGTIMWADAEAVRHGIDTERQLIFGIVPLGTGNDFARYAGWGGRNPSGIVENDFQVLRDLVAEWAAATPRPHDVWQVSIEVCEDGGDILKVDSESEEASIHKRTLVMPMINYFSVGQECKVGIEFDKHRTKSQTCNLFVYAAEGALQELQCGSVQHVGNLVSGLYQGSDSSGKVLLDSRDDDDGHGGPELVGNPESLIVLNINSYAGGKAHFWQRGTDNFGVAPRPDAADVELESNPGDGRLEVVTLPSIANIPLDRISHAARRVASAAPLFLEFFESEDEDVHAYAEVDGEFYHLVNPEYASVVRIKRLSVLQKRGA
eukprot:TRINITY_DN8767_c0_g2_i2.p2 TRINITY_DN8767_c0_g2~~TRINITY_DN8767_c0_g2_i2.p2  ORF type:complete len:512 (-),score=102.27 TRINITY_DN8767_c0_g2_i2:43-1362(-)